MNHEKCDQEQLDWSLIKARMDTLGIATMGALVEAVEVSRSSLFNARKNGKCSKHIFDEIMKGLGLHEEKMRRMPARPELPESRNERIPPNGWTVESIETPTLVAANEVSYQVVKLKSTLISNPPRYARGKFYDALYVPRVSQREYQERLTRHATVCSRLPRSARVPRHIDIRILGEGSAYWVLDEWIPSTRLSELIDDGLQLPESRIKTIGAQALETLDILHSNQCVVRELSPERMLLEDNTGDCFLTDFELARMLDTDISVSGKWKLATPYRAPEVSDNDSHWQSDLYSWAMIMVELFSGEPKADKTWVQSHSPTPSVAKLLLQCLDVVYYNRPKSISAVLSVWQDWNAK